MPYFLYEVSVYKVTKDMAFLMGSQLYKSDKPLNIKNSIFIKRHVGYSTIRYINILGVTRKYVEENNLPIYELQPKKKFIKKKKNERTR